MAEREVVVVVLMLLLLSKRTEVMRKRVGLAEGSRKGGIRSEREKE